MTLPSIRIGRHKFHVLFPDLLRPLAERAGLQVSRGRHLKLTTFEFQVSRGRHLKLKTFEFQVCRGRHLKLTTSEFQVSLPRHSSARCIGDEQRTPQAEACDYIHLPGVPGVYT